MKPSIRVVCAQPTRGHYIQGLKNMQEAIVPEIYDPSKIDIQELIESEEAIDMARRIIASEGIFAGMSSGAAMLAALRTAERIDSGKHRGRISRPGREVPFHANVRPFQRLTAIAACREARRCSSDQKKVFRITG